MHDQYLGLSVEKFADLSKRYAVFQDSCNDLEKEPVKVFSKLSEQTVAELLLIRGISQDLQKKKEEDMKKQAQAAQEAKEETVQEKPEDTAEDKTPETEK